MAVRMSRGRRLVGRFNLLLSVALAILVWIAITALAGRPRFKLLFDLTPQAQFSVSEETEALLDELDERGIAVRIDTFFGRLPAARNAAEQHYIDIHRRIQELTRDLLVRYRELGGERIVVTHYDAFGEVAAARSRIEELGGLRDENVVVVSVGKRHKELQLTLDLAEIELPAARAQQVPGSSQAFPTLRVFKGEEAISSAIRSLLVEGSPRLYFLDGYDGVDLIAGQGDSYSEFLSAAKNEGFEIGLWNLESEGRIPDDAAALVALEPRKEISAQAAELLYGWLRRGGRLFLNLSWSEVSGPTWNPTWDELGKLCGFEFGLDLVCHLVPDPARPSSPGVGGPFARNLVITGLAAHPITRPLARAGRHPQLTHAREVRARAASDAGTSFEPILRTGPYAWLAPRVGESEADMTAPAEAERYGPRTVAAVLDVPAESATRPGQVVLLGGVAFLNARGFRQNADFGLNVLNWLTQRSELVTIRGHRYESDRIQLVPQQVARAETLLRLIVPGTLLALGLSMFWLRRRA